MDGRCSLPGIVRRREPALRGYTPDLEEVHLLGAVALLGMAYSRARGCHLEIASLQDLAVAHRVLAALKSIRSLTGEGEEEYALLELAGDDVGEYLELAMSVRAEARLRFNTVLVQHAQAAELVVLSVVVPAHTKEVTPCS